jgi:hypothetical protein
MKRLVLYVVNSIPALVISYRPSVYVDYNPIGPCDTEHAYHRITGATLQRLLRLNHGYKHHINYLSDPKTGTEVTILTLTGGSK